MPQAQALEEILRRRSQAPFWQTEQTKQAETLQAQERVQQERQAQIRKRRAMQEKSIRLFMTQSSSLRLDHKEKTPSAILYDAYCRWCEEEGLFPESLRTFCLELKKNAREYQIAPTNFHWQGRHVRGFRGVVLGESP